MPEPSTTRSSRRAASGRRTRPPGLALAATIAGSEGDGDESEFNPFLADEEAAEGGDDVEALVPEPEEEGAEAK